MNTIGTMLILALKIYEMMIIFRIIMSWIPMDSAGETFRKVVDFIEQITDPVLLPAREMYSKLMNKFNLELPIDLSPILIFLVLKILIKYISAIFGIGLDY